MCKIMSFTNFSKVKNPKTKIEYIAKTLLETEDDGFGYAAWGESGIFGERTMSDNFQSYLYSKVPEMSAPFVYKTQNCFGIKSKIVGAAIFHGRISTNSKSLMNTHPINRNGWSLIHNGVVSNVGAKYEQKTTNDSEHVVQHLSTGGIEAVANGLTGYYAFTAIDPTGKLHVVKDRIAWQFVANVPEIETLIFATTKDLIADFCKEFKYAHSPIEEVVDDTYLVFNPNTSLAVHENFISKGYATTYEKELSAKSLSYMDASERLDYASGWGTMSWTAHDEIANASTSVDSEEKIKMDYVMYSQEAFLNECETVMDASYQVYDELDRRLTVAEFKALDDGEKLICTVIRADGTIVDPADYENERLYAGMI